MLILHFLANINTEEDKEDSPILTVDSMIETNESDRFVTNKRTGSEVVYRNPASSHEGSHSES